MRRLTAVVAVVTVAVSGAVLLEPAAGGQASHPIPDYARDGRPADLPLPSSLPLQDYEAKLYAFLFDRTYTELNWAVDRYVRDTGPYILGSYYGTHPAVRVYYSPGVLEWIVSGRAGQIPEGAMIVKEMYAPHAARYRELRAEIEARYADNPAMAEAVYETELGGLLSSWTVLVKDPRVSNDGWFWANPAPGLGPDTFGPPFNFPASGAGLGTCLRCHASAEHEATFSSLNNIRGFEALGEPLRFRVDDSWRSDLPSQQRPAAGVSASALVADFFRHMPQAALPKTAVVSPALFRPDPAFLATFAPVTSSLDRLLPLAAHQVQAFPGQWSDHVPAAPGGAEQFITSDNCLGCHGGLAGAPSGVTMFVETGPAYGDGYNVSEFGEWRWSPMGLAGRDPIFFAQLESELAILERDAAAGRPPFVDDSSPETVRTVKQALVNTCMNCHGSMGQRQLAIDSRAGVPPVTDSNFYYPDYLLLTDPLTTAEEERLRATTVDGLDGPHSVYPYRKYGNLAREGISCTVCHHIDPPTEWREGMTQNEQLATFLLHSTTGIFPYSPRDELNGPFADVKTRPMENALDITPKDNPYMEDAKLCGTCHVINLPNVDAPTTEPLPGLSPTDQRVLNEAAANATRVTNRVPLSDRFTGFQHSIEQATYLEWENSSFAYDPVTGRTCQECHMPGGLHTLDGAVSIDQLSTQIATIQDSSYADVEEDLPDSDIEIPIRDDYRRHAFVGLNVFLLEMFNQFDPILGVAQTDYMTGADNGDELAIEEMLRQAREETVAVDVQITSATEERLGASVTVTNKVGHRFPSGVGFRRAFLEVLVVRSVDGREEVVWGSGRTNTVGVIVDGAGAPLESAVLRPGGRPRVSGVRRGAPG